jgi:endoglucanase
MSDSRRMLIWLSLWLLLLPAPFFVLASRADVTDPFLAASGLNIRNGHGTGDVVQLRGVNLGGWLIMEGWMCPMDSSGLPDNYSVIQTLDNRFGVVTEQNLIRTYQDNWITTNDLDNIKAMGMNLIRLPIWWANLQTLGGTWRADAFSKIDWLVTNAWQRGIYTIIDLHGVPGGQSTADHTGQAGQNQYWTSTNYQSQTAMIWSNIAAHFRGNPAVAGYDLINEPYGAPSRSDLWSAYASLYQTVRTVDPDHIILMEGTLNSWCWCWDALPPPATYGWTNVVYQMHEYQFGSVNDPNGVMAGIDNQVNDYRNHQSWNVPAFIGEFNEFGPGADPASVWKYAIQQLNTNNMSWSVWSYKATHGGVPDSWGLYDPTGTWPSTPDIQSNSSSTISNRWSSWRTTAAFAINPMLQHSLGGPLAIADSYTATGGVTLVVTSGTGVLANDQDINAGQPGIQLSAVWVDGPANGQVTLNANGSFTYTPQSNYIGTDSYRYRVFDGYMNSANIATVSIQVGPSAAFLQWLLQYFNDTNSPPAAPTADPDGDNFSNFQEYLAGTDPTNNTSSFRITSIIAQGNALQVTWMCGAGKTNVLQASDTIAGTYSNISPNIAISGNGLGMTNYVHTGALAPSINASSDNASDVAYPSGNFNGASGGTGFGPWLLTPTANTGSASWFVGSSTNNGSGASGGIDSSGKKSWGARAKSGVTASAVRAFSSGRLIVGQTFAIDMDNGWVEAGDSVGLDLQNSSGQTLLEISYIGANSTGTYSLTDAGGQRSIGVSYTDGGVHLVVTLTSPTTYSATMKPSGGSSVPFSGTLTSPAGGQGISQVRLFNANAAAGLSGPNWDVFWNNLQVSAMTNASTHYYRVQLIP